MEFLEPTPYGILIRLNREFQNLNLSTLANDSGISIGQLSKIENCLESTSDKIYANIFSALDIEFEKVKTERLNIQTIFKDIYKSIVYMDNDLTIRQSICAFISKYEKDFISLETLLMRLIFNRTYTYNDIECESLVSNLKKVINHSCSYFKCLFYIYFGLYLQDNGNMKNALICLELALNMSIDPMLTAMNHYFLGQLYRKKRLILKSYESLLIAKNHFITSSNFKRYILNNLLIANLYSANNEYDSAIELYINCIADFSKVEIDLYSRSITYVNILWVYIMQDKYTEAYQFINQIPQQEQDFLKKTHNKTYALYNVIILNHIGKQKEAHSICELYVKNNNENEYNDNYLRYYYYLHSQKKLRIKYLQKNLSLIRKHCDYSELRLLFKLLENEYTSDKQTKELRKLYQQYIFHKLDN